MIDTDSLASRGFAVFQPNYRGSDQSGSGLAREAGINDIGSSGRGADDNSRAGLFDSASNDDDHDDADRDSDDFDGDSDGDSDYA